MLPTFIIAGAGKSGTSTLWQHAREHPQVGVARFKEPAYFTRQPGIVDGAPPHAAVNSGRYDKGITWYQSLFDDCYDCLARGEASTIYMAAADAPNLIKNTLPNVNLIFILRDPAARLYSHYWQEKKQGWELPPFSQMVENKHPRFIRYLYVSTYHIHLKRYLSVFPPDQVAVFLYEDLGKSPQKLLKDFYTTIGVDPGFLPSSLGSKRNPAGLPRLTWMQRLLTDHRVVNRVSRSSPVLIRPLSLIRRTIWTLNTKRFSYPPMSPSIRQQLLIQLEPTVAFIEELLSRDLPAWREV